MTSINTIETLLIFACRYCHNRETGAALLTVSRLISIWDEITDSTKETIIKEAKSDHTCNLDDWEILIDFHEGGE